MIKIFKNIILSLMVVIMLGCSEKRIVLVPQSQYYPTFPIEDFRKSEKYKIDMWLETEEVNGSVRTYLGADKIIMLDFIEDTKHLRSNYNTLVEKISKFNQKIKELNKIQQDKKPKEVDSIDESWFK